MGDRARLRLKIIIIIIIIIILSITMENLTDMLRILNLVLRKYSIEGFKAAWNVMIMQMVSGI